VWTEFLLAHCGRSGPSISVRLLPPRWPLNFRPPAGAALAIRFLSSHGPSPPPACPFFFLFPTVLKSGSQFGGQLHGSPSSTGPLLCSVMLRPAYWLKSITTL